jgi:hypothetical protein
MTIDKKHVVTIPVWLLVLILPILISGIVGYAASRYNSGATERQVDINTGRLDNVEKDKVDNGEFDMLKDQLNRIETKTDRIETKVDRVETKVDEHLRSSSKITSSIK